jgi:uncharacterized membrane protein YfcA
MTSAKRPEAASPTPFRGQLARHFGEMVVAMLVGMAVLGMAVRATLALLGRSDLLEPIEAQALVMTVNMAAGMSVWMRYRRHRWNSIIEMDAAMAAAFVVALLPYWAGLLPGQTVMMVGHVLMLPAMALVMLRRRRELTAMVAVRPPGGLDVVDNPGGPVAQLGDGRRRPRT